MGFAYSLKDVSASISVVGEVIVPKDIHFVTS